MRFRMAIFIVAVMLAGCTHLDINKNVNALKKVQPGDALEGVIKTLGLPYLRHDINDQRFVAFYQTEAGHSSNTPITTALCTPIAFERRKVVAVGDDMTEAWTREEEERQRKQYQSELAEAETAKAAQDARQEKIDAIEKAVKPVPASNAALNLKLYRQLLDLDPENNLYQGKVAFYEAQSARQKKVPPQPATGKTKERPQQAWTLARGGLNKMLRRYTGNNIAKMAVQDMGNGSLYVWVKNVSKQIITTHPEHFTLVDSANNKTSCQISASLNSVLEPGSISHGQVNFSKEIKPKELIFQSQKSGRISKLFY
jgi:hypothetical protein